MIKVESQGPIFFKQERISKNKKIFKILKFRTMKEDITAENNFDFSKDQKRITTIGSFLRRFKFDELPQLINVLKGDMSLVGPRPTVLKQVNDYNTFQMQRLKMKPGMTGLAQINGNTSLSWDERIKYDVYYVNNYSLILDFKILFKTIFIVLFGESKFKQRKGD